jgi:hypothetical protein
MQASVSLGPLQGAQVLPWSFALPPVCVSVRRWAFSGRFDFGKGQADALRSVVEEEVGPCCETKVSQQGPQDDITLGELQS